MTSYGLARDFLCFGARVRHGAGTLHVLKVWLGFSWYISYRDYTLPSQTSPLSAGHFLTTLTLLPIRHPKSLSQNSWSGIELWMTSGVLVSSGSDPDISSRPLASSCLIHPLSFQTLSANLMTTFLLFKPSYHHRPDLIPTGAFALFKSWQGHDLCVTCCRAKKTTSKNQSSASQKRYSSIPLDHAP